MQIILFLHRTQFSSQTPSERPGSPFRASPIHIHNYLLWGSPSCISYLSSNSLSRRTEHPSHASPICNHSPSGRLGGPPPFFCFTNLSKHIFQEAPIMHLPSEFTLPLPGGQKNLLMLLLSELTLLPESQMTPFAFLPSLLALTFQEARGSLLYISHLSKHLSSSRPLSCISHLISPSGVPFCVSPI